MGSTRPSHGTRSSGGASSCKMRAGSAHALVVVAASAAALAKMLPKIYGDKIAAEITGANGGPVELQATRIDVLALEPEQREQLKQILLAATKGKSEDDDR